MFFNRNENNVDTFLEKLLLPLHKLENFCFYKTFFIFKTTQNIQFFQEVFLKFLIQISKKK